MKANAFRHPINGYEEKISWEAEFWVFLFGGWYLLYKGLWKHFLVWCLVLSPFACIWLPLAFFVSWFILGPIYMFTVRGLLRQSYLQAGWVPVGSMPPPLPVGG
jgi:hypothetical protein